MSLEEQSESIHSNKFSRRKSKIQKNVDECIRYVQEHNFIVFQKDEETAQNIGFDEVFVKLVQNPKLIKDFKVLLSTNVECSKEFFDTVIDKILFGDMEETVVLLSAKDHMWKRIFCAGKDLQTNRNSERVAFTRITKKLKDNSAEQSRLLEIHANAYSMFKEEKLTDEIMKIYAQAKLVCDSEDVYYKFFNFTTDLQDQLSETISMNTSTDQVLNVKQSIAELFVRNQLLQFSKTNHSAKGNRPKEVKAVLQVDNISDIDTCIIKTFELLTEVRQKTIFQHELYLKLRACSEKDLRPSDDAETITKTQLRQWINKIMEDSNIDYRIRNSYDNVFCRLLTYLGETFDFSVRGNFRYPLSFTNLSFPIKPIKKKSKLDIENPATIIQAFDTYIVKLENKLSEMKRKRKAYMENDTVKEVTKKTRIENESEEGSE